MRHGVIPLVDGQLYLLPGPYELDGRVSTHAVHARGFASMNSYLLVEDGHAVLIDTGLSAHESLLLAQLDSVLDRATPLTIWPLRIGEFNSVCNVAAVARRFAVSRLCAGMPAPAAWIDFQADADAQRHVEAIPHAVIRPGDTLDVDPAGRRRVAALIAPIRLLPTVWVHDPRTRTLFTSDAFTHVWREAATGPWLVTDDDDPTHPAAISAHLTQSRFWWLAGADTAPLRAAIARVFDEHPVERVAPAFGCAIVGSGAVRRHVRMLDAVLAAAAAAPPSVVLPESCRGRA